MTTERDKTGMSPWNALGGKLSTQVPAGQTQIVTPEGRTEDDPWSGKLDARVRRHEARGPLTAGERVEFLGQLTPEQHLVLERIADAAYHEGLKDSSHAYGLGRAMGWREGEDRVLRRVLLGALGAVVLASVLPGPSVVVAFAFYASVYLGLLLLGWLLDFPL